jgi:hypothetical protein
MPQAPCADGQGRYARSCAIQSLVSGFSSDPSAPAIRGTAFLFDLRDGDALGRTCRDATSPFIGCPTVLPSFSCEEYLIPTI